jgi:uncharacterized protein involved in type VI secretion and phage assembly
VIPAPYPVPPLGRAHLGKVESVEDQDSLGRVQVRLYGCHGVADQDALLWARVAVPFAGADRGAFLLPDVGDEVLLVFVDGDQRFPIVVGSLWNGAAAPPESLPGTRVDRWTFTGKNGTRIGIIEESEGTEQVVIHTPNNATITVDESGGGEVTIEAGGTTVTVGPSGVDVQTSGSVTMKASSRMSVTAPDIEFNAGLVKCSTNLQCTTLLATTVTSGAYNVTAGNVL